MSKSQPQSDLPKVKDEPGMAERFQRGIRNLLNTPPQPRSGPTRKAKTKQQKKNIDSSNPPR
jgi:hypothetical protein